MEYKIEFQISLPHHIALLVSNSLDGTRSKFVVELTKGKKFTNSYGGTEEKHNFTMWVF